MWNKSLDKKKVMYIIIMILLAFLFCWTHLWKIEDILVTWNVDEIAMGYDAQCLKDYGTDRFGNSYPIYLKNFGGGQSSLYAYLCAFVLRFVSVSKFAYRLPGFICILVAAVYWCRLMIYMKERSWVRSCMALGLMSILPVYIMLFRIGMDCNLMMAVTPVFFFYLIRAVGDRRLLDYILAGVFGGLVLYTYAVSYVIMVAFLLLMFVYLLWIKRLTFKESVAFLIPLVILGLPLVLVQIVNMFNLEEFKIGCFTVTKLDFYRADEMKFSNITWETIKKCFASFLQCDVLAYNSVEEYWVMYVVSIPFIALGFFKSLINSVKSLKKREWTLYIVFTVWFLIIFVTNTMITTNVNRINGIFVATLFFIIEGILWVVDWFKVDYVRGLIVGIILTLYVTSFIGFARFYYGGEYLEKYRYPYFCADTLEEALDTAEYMKAMGDYSNLFIKANQQTYIYYAHTKKLNRDEFFIGEDGKLRDDYWWRYKEDYLFIPEEPDERGVYVIDYRCHDEIEKLEEKGFCFEKKGCYYVCYKE